MTVPECQQRKRSVDLEASVDDDTVRYSRRAGQQGYI